jgi:hypothetical protein
MTGLVDGMTFFGLFAGAVSFGLVVHVLVERRLNGFFAPILDAFGSSIRRRRSRANRRTEARATRSFE